MFRLELKQFAEIVGGDLTGVETGDQQVSNVSIDSRCIPRESVFFALQGSRTDGHLHVADAFRNGAAAAVIARGRAGDFRKSRDAGALVQVTDPLQALQAIAAWWRKRLSGSVVAVTGSRGKTLVKDLLHRILSETTTCYASPGSYKTLLGVPLSLLHTPERATFAVLEAGAAVPGEMDRLRLIVRPDRGIITNVGWASLSSFGDREALAGEMARLFSDIPEDGWVLVPGEDPVIRHAAQSLSCPVHAFGFPSDTLPYVVKRESVGTGLQLTVRFPSGETAPILLSNPSLEIASDVDIAIAASHLLGASPQSIRRVLSQYEPGPTRLEIWKSPTGVTLINDSFSFDPLSVQAALRTLQSSSSGQGRRFFVFGGAGDAPPGLAPEVGRQIGMMAAQYGVDDCVLLRDPESDAVGQAFAEHAPGREFHEFESSAGVRDYLLPRLRWGDSVLVKGPRYRGIDRVATDIMEAMAPNRLIVDLNAIAENVSRLRRRVGPKVRLLAMLKALAYGSESTRLSVELEHVGVDCIGVSSADEGASLRAAGVGLPILVMMCMPGEADKAARYNLTPVIYAPELVRPMAEAARIAGNPLNVHLEVDTGMGRLGVRPEEAPALAQQIAHSGWLHLVGVMTHFASADLPDEDSFTRRQIREFEGVMAVLREMGFHDLIAHLAATSGAIRFPEAHGDMVRIGIGLYGIYPSEAVAREMELVLAVSLVSRIAKIKSCVRGDRIGYGGTFQVQDDRLLAAVVPIGYHDGIPVSLSNRGSVVISGIPAPILGRVSMDSMMVDVTGISGVTEGVDVLIYGSHGGYTARPEAIAKEAEIIPYELLARLGPRVQRIFIGR